MNRLIKAIFQRQDMIEIPRSKLNALKNRVRIAEQEALEQQGINYQYQVALDKSQSNINDLKDKIRAQNNADVIMQAIRLILRCDKQGLFPSEKTVQNNLSMTEALDQALGGK